MGTEPKQEARDGKRWMAIGKPFLCPKCGWVLAQAASNTDKKRNIVCQCPQIPIGIPTGGAEG